MKSGPPDPRLRRFADHARIDCIELSEHCPRTWGALMQINEERVRLCLECKRAVYLVVNDEELIARAEQQCCVAVLRLEEVPAHELRVESARVIYCAIGEFPEAIRGDVRKQLCDFENALATGCSPSTAAAVLPHASRRIAEDAAALIREFEAIVGEDCGAEVGNGASPPAGISHERSISLENRGGKLFRGREAAGHAARVAAALATLLGSLGATKVVGCHID